MFRPMKPETIARRTAKREQEQGDRRANMLAGLRRNAERDGPDSIWVEMLAEQEANA